MNAVDGILSNIKSLSKRVARLEVQDKPTGIAWTDYSATSTIVGWSAFTTKALSYARYGNIVHVAFYFVGTSDSTSTNFTVPYASAVGFNIYFLTRASDNGGAMAAARGGLGTGVSTVNLYSSVGSAAWTNSGTKETSGQFFYWCA